MKIRNLLLLASFVLALFAESFAARVEKEEAGQIAVAFMTERIHTFNRVDAFSTTVSEILPLVYQDVTVFYAVNFADGGFALISADDNMLPVIGYAYTGSYSFDNQPISFRYFMGTRKEEAHQVITGNFTATEEVSNQWNLLRTGDIMSAIPEGITAVQPLVISPWNQDYPYNALCPAEPSGPGGHVYAGCVATSMAMIMYYYRYPEHGIGEKTYYSSFEGYTYGPLHANFGQTYYDWDAMLNVVTNQSGNSIRAVAELQYHCGIAVNMGYSPNGSGAFSHNVPAAMFNYFGYSTTINYTQRQAHPFATWVSMLKAQHDANYPVYYSGSGPDGGHAWVCDGYEEQSGETFFHMNWGWGGWLNAFFNLNSLNTSNGSFNNNQAMIRNFHPPLGNFPPALPTETHVITSQKGTFEDGSSPIANYGNNVNVSWLIAPHDTVNSITLSFNLFETLPNDIVTIYDGDSDSAPVLATYSGSDLPPSVTSTGDRLFIKFTTDATGRAKGWQAEFHSQVPVHCSGIVQITEPTGMLHDGSGQFNYNNGSLCRWRIQPPSAKDLVFTFTSFDTEPEKDYVELYDLSNNALLGRFSGNVIPPATVVPSGRIFVVWRTSHFDTYPGWEAEWTIGNVGIEKTEDFTGYTMYPNPAKNVLNLSFAVTEQSDISVRIATLTGQIVYHEDINRFSGNYMKALDTSNYPSGVYLVTITNNKSTITEKLIIE
jgi:hypothetical protein